MKINLTGHHVDLTDPLREYVNSKMDRLERHFDHVTDTHVVLSVEKLRHKAEATMHISGGKIFADAEQENMYAAIDSLSDKLDRQVRRYKQRLRDNHHGRAENAASNF